MGRKNNSVPAKCHPERLNLAKGLCASCYRKQQRYSTTQTTTRLIRRLNKYKLTLNEYEYFKKIQSNKCKICLRSFLDQKVLCCIDHNHKTGKVRGLLCQTCNLALGIMRENEFNLARLIAYLKWSGTIPASSESPWTSTDFVDLRPASATDRPSTSVKPSF